jgi:hypothetical protein
MRPAWAETKRQAQEIAESRARVAAYIAEIKAKNLIAGPARPLPPIPGFSGGPRFRRAA